MQDRYVGDIGDFGKYGMLRILGSTLRLGVNWYLNEQEDAMPTGGLTGYLQRKNPQLRDCDPALFACLYGLVDAEKRNVAAVQYAGILPRDTCYFAALVPATLSPYIGDTTQTARTQERDRWCQSGLTATADANVVFCDPDNGIAGEELPRYAAVAPKYVFVEELAPYWHRGQSLIVYQHADRDKGGFEARLQSLIHRLHSVLDEADIWALRWRREQARAYLVLARPEHRPELWCRSEQLLDSRWGRLGHYTLVTEPR